MRLFAYNSNTNVVKTFAVNDSALTKNYDVVFQTGPQIVLNNIIDSASIDSSVNGNLERIRTVFATVDDKDLYVVIARDVVTLKNLGQFLLDTGLFKGVLNVIDFDGGPSTSLYIKNQPSISFNVVTKLPLLLGVK